MKFDIKSSYIPILDQQKAIDKLSENFLKGEKYQTLLGVTGSGKTFTAANVIQKLKKPALIISHNKTLAAQLYQEMRDFFPNNAVSYFVSYYDYYQPEAYIPSTDTYIEKDSDINDLIDRLRLEATTNILTRNDTIVVASVSCIYNIGSPKEYGNFIFEMATGMRIDRTQIIDRLISLQYERSDIGFHRSTFRVRGDVIDIFMAYKDQVVSIELDGQKISKITLQNPTSGELIESLSNFTLFPAKHNITDPANKKHVFEKIRQDLAKQEAFLKSRGKDLEAHRLHQKVTYDIEMIAEVGYIKGIENYSRYFDGRNPGDPPFSLVDHFNYKHSNDWLVFVDESHITFPQIRGMYAGDQARKQVLVDYGFRLPSAFDNRPLTFDEFQRTIPGFIAVSATPSEFELSMSGKNVVEQLVRPTGIPDPEVEVRPVKTQVTDVMVEIQKRAKLGQRTLVTTLTKVTAEDLAQYLLDKGIKAHYLHSDVKTLDRSNILDELRRGEYDALIGINLLREGLDLPEVSLVAILDADKEGFLRSEVALIQTMGRAARHVEGKVILYADRVTNSMKRAMDEVSRRRQHQIEMNKEMGITPKSISKAIREKVVDVEVLPPRIWDPLGKETTYMSLPHIDVDALTPADTKKLVKKLKTEMRFAAEDLNFELAAEIRDKIKEIEN
ncbi:MAG: excinuclease ABC subunit UvrB [Patescibacteria group bacterium]